MATTSRCAATARNPICEATVKVRVGDEIAHTVAEGDGPVNALDSALRAALVKFYPAAQEGAAHRLQGPHPRLRHRHRAPRPACSSSPPTASDEWGTVGVSDNIIEASLQALVDSMEYALMEESLQVHRRYV